MLFVQDQYQYLLTKSMCQENYLVSQFDNQEFLLKLTSLVDGRKCTVLGSLTSSADQVLEILLLLHTLKQAGAQQLTLISPYLSYQRQDRHNIGFSHGLQWADAMLHAVGVQRIITIEPHCSQSLKDLDVPVTAYSVKHIFENEMMRFVELGFSFVFPDAGARLRYDWIFETFPTAVQGSFLKNRLHDMIQLQEFQGKITRKVIIYDDILDSGQTLVQTCIALRHMGVEEIVIFVAHAFFHGQAWNDLWSLGVKALYCTDSLPAAHKMQHLQIHTMPIGFFLQKTI